MYEDITPALLQLEREHGPQIIQALRKYYIFSGMDAEKILNSPRQRAAFLSWYKRSALYM